MNRSEPLRRREPAASARCAERLARIAAGWDAGDEGDARFAVGVTAFNGAFRCGLRTGAGFAAASVGKVVVLGALLHAASAEGREPSEAERALAAAMITVSDNDAAVDLRDRIGVGRIQAFLDRAGMRATVRHPAGSVGLMTLTAADALVLLRLLRAPNSVLGAEQRRYARSLMSRVVPAQRWGVTAGAPDGAAVFLKNGWLPRSDTGAWRVHSIGGFRTPAAGAYDVAVLTEGRADLGGGIAAVERLARAVHSAVAAEAGRQAAGRNPGPQLR